jgi:hypothetical protein
MGNPVPAQGEQRQYVEQPLKIYGEQYLEGHPVPIGVATYAALPVYQDGDARVYLSGGGIKSIALTDWVITNRYSGQPIDVVSAEEFAERFGGQV